MAEYFNAKKILELVKQKVLNIHYLINTHSHSDHIIGNDIIVSNTTAKIVMHSNSNLAHDISVGDGDIIHFGNIRINVIHTPGHTQDSICLLTNGALMTGDTLFIGECGRTDLPGGSSSDLYNSQGRLLSCRK